MKNNLPWFQHDNDARNHPKMKALIARFDFSGYGRFWALNEIISHAEGARLDISKKLNRLSLAGDLGLSPDDFEAFLAFLTDPEIDLVTFRDGVLTTDRTSESYQSVEKARQAERDRKSGKKDFPPGKERFPPGKGDFPPGNNNRADPLRADKNSSSPEISKKGEEDAGSDTHESAPALSGDQPIPGGPDLIAFALKLALERKAKNPQTYAKKLAKEPDVIAAFNAQEAAAEKPKTRFLPDPPPCACGGKLKADIRNGFARCPECSREYSWDSTFEIWIEGERQNTA